MHMMAMKITPTMSGILGLVSMPAVCVLLTGVASRKPLPLRLVFRDSRIRAYFAHDTFSTAVARSARGGRDACDRHRPGSGNRRTPRVAAGHRGLLTRRRPHPE